MLLAILGSFSWVQLIVSILVVVVAYWFLDIWRKRKLLPPGPFPYPIVGNLLSIKFSLLHFLNVSLIHTFLVFRGKPMSHEYFITLAKEYGDPMSIWFGNKLAVVLNSKETIRETLVNKRNIFCSRQDSVVG